MSTLVAVGYDEMFKADEVLLKLRKLQREYLIDLEDAAVAIKDLQGKGKLHQTNNLTAAGAVSGGFWGSLICLIFLNPPLGFVVGATTGAISGALTDIPVARSAQWNRFRSIPQPTATPTSMRRSTLSADCVKLKLHERRTIPAI
jgi:uncharacterized membrane protein